MKFTETGIPGVKIVDPDPHEDPRGLSARLYCPDEFAAAGVAFTSTQMLLSRNTARHTLRGMHFNVAPNEEAKLVRCVSGRLFDVALDMRRDSPAYLQWTGVELDAASMRALFLPEGIAHGYLTLEDDSDVLYQLGRPFQPDVGAGVRWDDPAFAIDWPAAPAVINERDANYPDFAEGSGQ